MHDPAADNQPSLRARTLSAGAWALLTNLASNALRFGSSLLLTRLLVPEMFGVVSLASVVYMIVQLLSDIGLRQYVVFNPRGADRDVLDTIWSVSAVRGVIVTVVNALFAVAIHHAAVAGLFAAGSVYADPSLPPVLAGMGVAALILGVKSPKMFVLERQLAQRSLGIISIVSQVAGALVTLVLAWMHTSVWSIVAGNLVSAATTTLMALFWVAGPIGRMRWDKEIAKDLIRYGRWILLSSIAFVFAHNADRLLLGSTITPAELSFYTLALTFVQMFEYLVSSPINAIALPALSEVARQNRQDLRRTYFQMRLPFDLATLALSGAVFASGQFIIDVLYDSRYTSAGSTLEILALSLVFPRYALIAAAHGALGEPQTGSWVSVAKLASIVIAIPVGQALGGYEGALYAIALHMLPAIAVSLVRNQRHGLNNLRFELLVLLAWPVGYMLGKGAVRVGEMALAALQITP